MNARVPVPALVPAAVPAADAAPLAVSSSSSSASASSALPSSPPPLLAPPPFAPSAFRRWRGTLLALALLLPAIVWLYRDTALAMVSIWSRSDTFAHAYTVPPIAAWLIWRQRHVLARQTPVASAWLLLPVVGACVACLLGELSATNSLQQLAFTATLVLAAVAVLGGATARLIMFPLGFLFFAVPIGEFVMPLMMERTADVTVLALRLSGIPVFREGLQFVIPSGNWSVVEACSGVRYLIASFMVGVLFAYLNYRSHWRRWLFAAVSIVVPVVANWVRAYMIVMLGHLSGNQIAVGADHLIYGWVFFGVVILLMFMIGARWAEPDDVAVPAAARGASAGGRADLAALSRRSAAVATAALLIAAAPPAAMWRFEHQPAAAMPALGAPALAPAWQAAAPAADLWKPVFKNPAAEWQASYSAGGAPVGVYVGYYRQQGSGSKLVSSDNVLVPSNDRTWARLTQETRRVTSGNGGTEWRRTLLRDGSGHQRMVVWQLYWIDGQFTASDEMARARAALARLRGRGDDGAVIVLHAFDRAEDEGRVADTLLSRFAGDNLGALGALLQQARDNARPSTQGTSR